MKITFDDLVTKKYLKTVDVDITGLGIVTLHQVSALQATEISNFAQELTGDDLEQYLCRHALQFVKGSEVTDEELLAFRSNNTTATISEIYRLGLASTPASIDLESAEKN